MSNERSWLLSESFGLVVSMPLLDMFDCNYGRHMPTATNPDSAEGGVLAFLLLPLAYNRFSNCLGRGHQDHASLSVADVTW